MISRERAERSVPAFLFYRHETRQTDKFTDNSKLDSENILHSERVYLTFPDFPATH